MDAEFDVDIARCPIHHGVDHHVHVPTLAVDQNQTHDISPELELVEIPLLPEA